MRRWLLEDLFEFIQPCSELAGAFGFFLVIVTRFADVDAQIEEREIAAAPLDELPFAVDERDVGGSERFSAPMSLAIGVLAVLD